MHICITLFLMTQNINLIFTEHSFEYIKELLTHKINSLMKCVMHRNVLLLGESILPPHFAVFQILSFLPESSSLHFEEC